MNTELNCPWFTLQRWGICRQTTCLKRREICLKSIVFISLFCFAYC